MGWTSVQVVTGVNLRRDHIRRNWAGDKAAPADAVGWAAYAACLVPRRWAPWPLCDVPLSSFALPF